MKKEKLKTVLIGALVAILIIIISLIGFKIVETSVSINVSNNSYTYTTAICTDSNYCQDYIVACENGEVASLSPIEDAEVQYSPNWKDPRDNSVKEKLC